METIEEIEKNPTTHIKFEPALKERMKMLVSAGQYSSINELIRDAVRHLLQSQEAVIERELAYFCNRSQEENFFKKEY